MDRLKIYILIIITVAAGVLLQPINTKAAAGEITEPTRIEMTCYYNYTGNVARNGQYPRTGTCAYKKQYIGDYLVLVYEDTGDGPGELIGYYEVYDTGYGRPTKQLKEDGTPYGTLELGLSIDIFQNTLADCKAFIKAHGDHCYIQVIHAEG